MSDTPSVCSFPQMAGKVIEQSQRTKEIRRADLNADGVKDEYFTVFEERMLICGETPESMVVDKIRETLGVKGAPKKVKGGGVFATPLRRVSYRISDGTTEIVNRWVSMRTPLVYPLKHLKTKIGIGDPLKLADGKTYFFEGVDLNGVFSWDGKKMKVNHDKIRLSVVTKEMMIKGLKGEKVDESERKFVKLSEIASVVDRKEHPDVYAKR